MKRVLAICLLLCLALSACTAAPQLTEPSSEPTSEPTEAPTLPPETTQATEAPTQPPTEPPTEAPTEPPVLYRNPLTGEPLDAPLENRIMAVVINNASPGLPHLGTSHADIMYEILAEGGVTRCLAIYSDIAKAGQVGSIRSARTYLVDLANSYDAIFTHAGGSPYGMARIKELHLNDLDGITGAAVPYMYRNKDRLNAGYALEHTLVSTGQELLDFAAHKGYDLTVEPGTTYGLNFSEDAVPQDGEPAEVISIRFLSGGKTTVMTYHPDTGMYTGVQYKKDFLDGNTDTVVQFRNIFVLKADSWLGSDGYLRFTTLVGEGDGYFACGGKIIPIRWHRATDDDYYTYTLLDGTPLVQGIGASFIAVTPLKGIVTYE